jgi:pimeloyl-ACP methyl ester carboxylesterase
MKNLIVYVHGAFCSRKSWNYLRHVIDSGLSEKNLTDAYDVSMFEYDVTTDLTEDIARNLVEALKSEAKKYDKVWFIAHSYGGVVSVAAARELLKLDSSLNLQVISMATPFGGSEAASLISFLKPGSIFIRNVGSVNRYMLNFKSENLPCKVHALVTYKEAANWGWIENDGVVSVESELHYEKDPNFSYEFSNMAHSEVLLSEDIGSWLVDRIAVS